MTSHLSESAIIIAFPALEKCRECAGSGLTWSFQRRTKRRQAAAKCTLCGGHGKTRNNLQNAEVCQPEGGKKL